MSIARRVSIETPAHTVPPAIERVDLPPPSRGGRDFVARSLAGMAESIEQAVFSERTASAPGLLQGLDARAKLGATLLLLLAAGLVRHPLPLLGLAVLSVLLAGLSRLPVVPFARRAWLGIPLFAAAVALPSLFLLPGRPLLVLIGGDPIWLSVSDAGAGSFVLLLARVGASVSLALLLVSTTRWADLLRALRSVGVPESFVTVLGMTYRYLFLFLRSASNLFLARASRTVGAVSSAEGRRWAATATGALAGRSVRLSGDVLMAMRARGFDGEIRALQGPRMREEDWLALVLAAMLAAATILLDGMALWG